jgi:hypothetical protein
MSRRMWFGSAIPGLRPFWLQMGSYMVRPTWPLRFCPRAAQTSAAIVRPSPGFIRAGTLANIGSSIGPPAWSRCTVVPIPNSLGMMYSEMEISSVPHYWSDFRSLSPIFSQAFLPRLRVSERLPRSTCRRRGGPIRFRINRRAGVAVLTDRLDSKDIVVLGQALHRETGHVAD